ncbi:hypothetical protein [Nocardia asteroides]|uniref:hypothetical protein n=1 Tax=Nocardia asteroides TaxID=1824 RepID=UPI001E561769|nr:hypothetical protein [Nocardia asteroides]UGT54918.1 hypothetical protein LTT85_30670 [Nocardia asteroides]
MHTTDRHPVTVPAEPAVVWPEPSPLDTWWTEIMDGVPPRRDQASPRAGSAAPG